jgi:hypothetical protein
MKAAGFIVLALATCSLVQEARAIPPFRDAFKTKYVDNSNDPAFKAAFDTAKCNLCHVPHKDKKIRNDYGKALAKITGGNVSRRLAGAPPGGGQVLKDILKTFDQALDKVADDKSSTGETYGERIKAGKLPNP